MAKFVIAGKANCPHFAKAELLGDYLQRNLPHFSIHKWPIANNEWDQWLKSICEKYQWKLTKGTSPLIWRELIDRGGRATLIGDLNDFQEYAQSYYGVLIDQFMSNSSKLFRSIAEENVQQYEEDLKFKKEYFDTHVHRYYIGIIGADHPCTYALFPHLLSSFLFPQRDICIRLITNDSTKLSLLKALAMEIEDLACEQFHQIEVTLESDEQTYEQIDLFLVLDDFFSQTQEKYFDELVAEKARLKQTYDDANLFDDERPPFEPQRMIYDLPPAYERYRTLANQIQTTIKSTCRILLACGNSTMVATQAFLQTIRTLPTNQILGLSRTVENLAKSRIGKKLQTDIQNVVDLHIIGDINGEYIIDTSHCQTIDYEGAIWAKSFARNSAEMLADAKWVKEVIGKEVEQRYFELYTYVEHNRPLIQNQSSAIISFIHDWLNGSNDERSYSCVMLCSSSTLGLLETNDEEKIIETIVCSIPVRMHGHNHIEPIELNFSNENRTIFTRIIKDIQSKYHLE